MKMKWYQRLYRWLAHLFAPIPEDVSKPVSRLAILGERDSPYRSPGKPDVGIVETVKLLRTYCGLGTIQIVFDKLERFTFAVTRSGWVTLTTWIQHPHGRREVYQFSFNCGRPISESCDIGGSKAPSEKWMKLEVFWTPWNSFEYRLTFRTYTDVKPELTSVTQILPKLVHPAPRQP